MSFSTLFKPSIHINGKKYKIIDQIGEGGFAYVYKVMSVNKEDHNQNYALKKMICQTDEQMSEAKKEIELMKSLVHPSILSLLDSAYNLNNKGQNEVIILMPLMSCSLQNMIDEGLGYPYCCFVDGLDVLKVLRHCIDGIAAIHTYGIRHADLKPANILLDHNYQAVITDFGSASTIPHVINTRSEALVVQEKATEFSTASYRAPELFNTPSECCLQGESDIWSLGCIIFSIFYSRSPFESPTEGLSTLSLLSGQYHIPDSNIWPEEYLALISKCLKVNPSERISTTDLELIMKCIICPPIDLESIQSEITTNINKNENAAIVSPNTERDVDLFSTSAMSTTIDTITSYGHNDYHKEVASDTTFNHTKDFADFTTYNNETTYACNNETTCACNNETTYACNNETAYACNNETTYACNNETTYACNNETTYVTVEYPLKEYFEKFENSLKLSDFNSTLSSDTTTAITNFNDSNVCIVSNNEVIINDINSNNNDEFGDFTAVDMISSGSIDDLCFSHQENINIELKNTIPSKYNNYLKPDSFQRDNIPIEELETIDLWQTILSESQDHSLVIKEGPVYMMRYSGFPKKHIKKQIWLVLTKSGIVLRKEKDPKILNAKIYEIVSLQKQIYMTHSDTMAIGLNGLSIQGSTPISIHQDTHNLLLSTTKTTTASTNTNKHRSFKLSSLHIHNLHPHTDSNNNHHHKSSQNHSNHIQEEWVKVILLNNNTTTNNNLTPAQKLDTKMNHDNDSNNMKRTCYKSKFDTCIFEISFENKNIMNEWMDIIELQRDKYTYLL